MDDKSLHEFSAPTTANIRTGLAIDINGSFELKPMLPLFKSLLLWKRWPPIKVRVKRELKPAREMDGCTKGGGHASCQDGPANKKA